MNTYVLANATIWPADGRAFDGYVVIQDDRIAEVTAGDYAGGLPVVDLDGHCLSPGLVDLMMLGGFNKSIQNDSPLAIAHEYLRLGVTSLQFCIGTLGWDGMERISANIGAAQAQQAADPEVAASSTRILGLYLEGPFQQPNLTGASLAQYALLPEMRHVERILADFGEVITMVNVAPGGDGAVAAVRRLREAGKIVSMAHSDATADRVLACVEAGTSVLGHIWDNNHALLGESKMQQPTIEHVALTDERVSHIHVICDGVHCHPIMIQLAVRSRGIEAICLVTDAVIRAGCEDGSFLWDDGRTFYKEGGVGRTDKGGLCGSALLLPDMFRNFISFTGADPAEAIATVTRNPARSLQRDDIGHLAPGKAADLVAWDDELRIARVWRAGQELQDVSDLAEVILH